ncbi:LOW QUALITY PROTEIN: phospholipid-transporting ATPase ABCA3-like [Amphiura filiformis]|uniref:LOW QUALITY PROTEIN: phospholipid-transporting ATPase ABCA3-like n=1 Tax=Amphiura filiformis TaxID=82378 RepID=UPI003B218527
MGWRLRQFKLLLWKNFVLQFRRPIGTTFEVLLPFFCACLLLVARVLIDVDNKCYTTFTPGFVDETASFDDFDPEVIQSCIVNQTDCPGLTYFPQNNFTRALIQVAASQIPIGVSDTVFASEDEMAKTASENQNEYYGASGCVPPTRGCQLLNLSPNISYSIRLPHDLSERDSWETARVYPEFQAPGPELYTFYKARFLGIQHAVDTSIALMQVAKSIGWDDWEDVGESPAALQAFSLEVSLQQLPFPAYTLDIFLLTLDFLLPFLLTLAFIYTAGTITRELCLEKELRLKESMKMMGLSNWVHWLAWFVKNFLFLCITTILIVILCKVGRIFQYTDGFLLFIFFMLWMISTIAWCFAVSVFFSRARLGFIFGLTLWYLNYLPVQFLPYSETSSSTKTAASLLHNTCFGIGVQLLSRFESMEVGLQWHNVGKSPSVDDVFTMSTVFGMFICDTIIYFIITWYVEAVFPGSFGIAKPFYFPFTRTYWCGAKYTGDVTPDGSQWNARSNSNDRQPVDPNKISMNMDPANHEREPSDLQVGIDIQRLTKVYKSAVGHKLAVDDLSLKMYKGQITSLLGHNGAGKTTTMSILTGLFPPTGGAASVNGYSILNDMEKVRQSLGICPQHNVLWDRLTVKEHLMFFIRLKGKSGEEAKQEVTAMIEDLQLVDKTNDQSSKLSGGMKRKLSCAIALVGGSEIVILDEPTSGMDPYARRATWDLLLKYKAGKTMVLTTHFMDEADLLGDRIAIMANGQLLCSGSSLFLKNRFGEGYHLTLVKNPKCDVSMVTDLIKKYVPNAELENTAAAEVDYILPRESTPSFKPLFTEMEGNRDTLGVDSFGVSITTLEEVFMKAGELAESKEQEAANGMASANDAKRGSRDDLVINDDMEASRRAQGSEIHPDQLIGGIQLKLYQFWAVFLKRFLCTLVDKKLLITQFGLPLLFVLLGLIFLKTTTSYPDDPERILTLANLSSVSENGLKAFHADLRTSSGDDIFEYLQSHLDIYDMESTDISSPVLNLNTSNEGDLILGQPKTSDSQCCEYTNIVLNDECADSLYNDGLGSDVCDEVETFGYYNCYDCLINDGDNCPMGANASWLSDPLTYFQSYLLNESNPTTFFEEHVAAFTLSDGEPLVITPMIIIPRTEVRAWYSNEAFHTSAEVLNALGNILLQYLTNDSYTITTSNHPLPNSATTQSENAGADPDVFTLALLVLFGLAFLCASFIPFVVAEKECKAKHLQMVSGLDPLTYWLANFAWDMVNYLVIYIILIILFAAFNLDAFAKENLGTTAILLILFGWAAIPFVYLLSTMFKTPVTAYAIVTTVLSILGMGTLITVFVLEIIGDYDEESKICDYVFSLLPTHCLSRSLMVMSSNDATREFCTDSNVNEMICNYANITYFENNLAWDSPGIGKYCLYLGLEGFIYFLLTVLIEVNFFIPSFSKATLKQHDGRQEDEDVAQERKKIETLIPTQGEYAVILKNLSKIYRGKPTPAVDQLCLAIPKGECFGLLGVNGAGKTTTFNMLTGDQAISAGTAYMEGFDIQKDRRKVQQRIGYCPQFDALVEKLTGREMLQLFARLRGIPRNEMERIVKATITHLNLDKWADKLCGTYSGGNKRKLNTAAALVGDPPIVFLDEPTSGMDPKARRHLWDALTSVMKGGRSIVLTSHSMEECEALCTRLAIMVNGQFKCLGSTQHLKSMYGKGYTMIIKTTDFADIEPIKQFVMNLFEGAELMEQHQGMLHYQVSNESLSWSYIFGTLEDNRETLKITDYSVSQTSLEQVFINFAKHQHDDSDAKKGKSSKKKSEVAFAQRASLRQSTAEA